MVVLLSTTETAKSTAPGLKPGRYKGSNAVTGYGYAALE
jgi:hypothetical protein